MHDFDNTWSLGYAWLIGIVIGGSAEVALQLASHSLFTLF